MEKEELIYLKELIRILESTVNQMRDAYERKDSERFNSLKKALFNIQDKIGRFTK